MHSPREACQTARVPAVLSATWAVLLPITIIIVHTTY